MKLVSALFELFLPARCVHCRSDYGEAGRLGLCDACRPGLRLGIPRACPRCSWPARSGLCRRCRIALPPFDKLHLAGWYSGVLGSIVKAAKFSEDRSALPILLESLTDTLQGFPCEAVVTIPSDHSLNGHLGEFFADHFKARRMDILTRPSDALRQVGLSRRARRANARHAINIAPKGEIPSNVLLVDDIVTTGATVLTATELLLREGAEHVRVVALARAR